jgi:hypothetical protein
MLGSVELSFFPPECLFCHRRSILYLPFNIKMVSENKPFPQGYEPDFTKLNWEGLITII